MEVGTALCFIGCFMFVSFMLQTGGLFTPKWGSNSTCEAIGLVISCCSDGNDSDTCQNTDGVDELDVRAFGLHTTSYSIMCLTLICFFRGLCNGNDDENVGTCAALGGCCYLMLPVAGLFNIIGCIIVATKFSTSDLGFSFALCLTSGCLILIGTIFACCMLLKSSGDDDSITSAPSSGNTISNASRYGATYPHNEAGSGGGCEAQQATIQQTIRVHDHESGGIMVFIRRINITKIARRMGHGDS